MKYLLNIFDLDGTLVDSHEAICLAINEILEHYGMPRRSISELTKYIGIPLDETFRIIGITNIKEAFDIYHECYFPKIKDHQYVIHGIPELLRELKGKTLLAIATNKGKNGSRLSLEHTGLLDYFDVIITESEVKNLKPHPESFEKILEFYRSQGKNIQKEDVLMIGDSPTDIEFAYNSGIDGAYAEWGFTQKQDLIHQPKYFLTKPSQLIDIIGINEIIPVETTEELDLHTFQPKEIEALVADYLKDVKEKGFRTVRIIHGKGKGVQREIVRKVLEQTHFIKSFYDAPPYMGGFGATVVEIDDRK